MSTVSFFIGPRAKLDRAAKFIAEVEAELDAYNKSDPISASWDLSGSEITINWLVVPPNVLCALGDAVHNLRSSLDLMASELARLNGKSDKNIYFPFAASGDEFPAAIKAKNFHLAGDDAVALLKTLAPYRGGNECLRAIHDLDISDKHTMVLITQRTTKQLKMMYNLDEGPQPPIKVIDYVIEHNFLDAPLTGRPLVETLKELVQLVDGILEQFSSMLMLRAAPKV